MSRLTPEQLAAFQATQYVARAPGGEIVIRIGERNGPLDALLGQMGVSEWVFVTACNPHTTRASDEANGLATGQLKHSLWRDGARLLEGEGRGPEGGGWPAEHSFLVFGMDRASATALGRAWGQSAVVIGRRGEAAELLLLE